jgi:23S rRNA (cytidine1920-2'-O)/16S rRNA (cytidine1409-2'-O)-methyltransferase
LKLRLDELLLQRNLAHDMENARALIGAGEVFVNETRTDKAGHLCDPAALIRLKERSPYVSRGGLKLEKGLEYFKINPAGMVCLDVGASTGGFTDCLLQHGARKIYAIDVAYGQLDWKIRQNPSVVVIERFNARQITPGLIAEPIDLAVMDASFISITKLIPPLIPLFRERFALLALIKPQFELARSKVGKGGVVTDASLHDEAIHGVKVFAQSLGLQALGTVVSPILGPKGNKEFLVYLVS